MKIVQYSKSNSLQIVLWLYIVVAIGITLQLFLPSLKHTEQYTHYNNYVIFKNSFFHLINNKDLYLYYNNEQFDLYKYSPSFALLFGLLAYLPDVLGLLAWSIINALCLFYAVKMLDGITEKKKVFLLLFILLELINALQNSQSNALMAALIILAFVFLEKKSYFWASLFIVFSIYIKLFGVVAFALFLFYPEKIKLASYTIFWMIVLAILPLCVINPTQLIFLYKSWWGLLKDDHSASVGISAMGIVNSWLHTEMPKNLIVLIGAVLFLIPFAKISSYKNYYFRVQILASVLLWMVLFNHKAESPTFIIVMAGVGIWYFSQEKNTLNTVLLWLCFIGVSLSVSDLVPRYIKTEYLQPYSVKALLPLVIWLKLLWDLMVKKEIPNTKIPNSNSSFSNNLTTNV
jgi:hypothetical protein